jgi:hypothetical protein
MKKDDLHIITQKTKDRATRTPLETGGELKCPVPALLVAPSYYSNYKPGDKSWTMSNASNPNEKIRFGISSIKIYPY